MEGWDLEMAIIEGQKVKVKWNGRNKQHFIEKGYAYTKLGDEFEVAPEHLTNRSDAIIKAKCDYCNKEKEIIYNQYRVQVTEKNLDKYCCKECTSKKLSESHRINRKGFKLAKECDSYDNKGIIYDINSIDLLNEDQLILINEIRRFCEENGKFPTEKEMSNKNGYVSRTMFYKHFDTEKFTDIYHYIYPLQKETRNKEITNIQKELNKPNTHICSKCGIEKEFNKNNFSTQKTGKYGLRTMCKECENKVSIIWGYKQKGIIFNEYTDVSPEQWWEYLYEGIIGLLPEFCLDENNIIRIFRYVLLDKLKLNKKEICEYNVKNLKELKLYHLYSKYHDKLKLWRLCFPEFNITEIDLPVVNHKNDEVKVMLIESWVDENKLTLDDLIKVNFKTKENKKIESLVMCHFNGSYKEMLVWYFNEKEIRHPETELKITLHDFSTKRNGYWAVKENREYTLNKYCIQNDILKSINNTEMIKKWIKKYFTQEKVSELFNYSTFYETLYDALISVFPEIKDNNILFEWEWHQCNKSDREFLIKSLREMLLFREHKNTPHEISRFLRYSTLLKYGYTKFVKRVSRGVFDNYYEWACLAFPEFKDEWKLKDFYDYIANDGTVCDSSEEVDIYEFSKDVLKLDIHAIGTKYKGEHIFDLDGENGDKWYCPDFVITNGCKIYVEYFGLYVDNPKTSLLKSYKSKTIRKIDYYNTTDEKFIFLFPEDLKDNFKGMINKFNEQGIKLAA